MTEIAIRPCTSCGRSTRPSIAKLADHIGTVVRCGKNLCLTCYRAQNGSPSVAPSNIGPRVADVARSVVLATIPDARDPQRSDCQVRCCRNPFLCGTQYRCACHGARS